MESIRIERLKILLTTALTGMPIISTSFSPSMKATTSRKWRAAHRDALFRLRWRSRHVVLPMAEKEPRQTPDHMFVVTDGDPSGTYMS
jgi:hypothetical protein